MIVIPTPAHWELISSVLRERLYYTFSLELRICKLLPQSPSLWVVAPRIPKATNCFVRDIRCRYLSVRTRHWLVRKRSPFPICCSLSGYRNREVICVSVIGRSKLSTTRSKSAYNNFPRFSLEPAQQTIIQISDHLEILVALFWPESSRVDPSVHLYPQSSPTLKFNT